jgi:hypothetical protein
MAKKKRKEPQVVLPSLSFKDSIGQQLLTLANRYQSGEFGNEETVASLMAMVERIENEHNRADKTTSN